LYPVGGFHSDRRTWHCRFFDNRDRGLSNGDGRRILFVDSLGMPTFIYRCPITGFRVHSDAPDEPSQDKGEHFEPVKCTACKCVHLVNPKTGKLIGERDK
jgi:hypothetical protein